ncbi:MAG: 16S rRNA (adenine(1518)-N(6)/adenine(1519)-N(6))-dimethyltransferase RsmA [Alphaproteobacteria bacterium]|nr:16S rRNA (adenine(1518)-N(6)/adenine(1519)-N(6))-dimethyltransferase RsmA [Alphaproteobacteria bacterium]
MIDKVTRDVKETLSRLPPLRDVIRNHDLRAEKKFGQNFLLDLNITDKIARSAGDLSDCTIFEVGPGPGGLTRALLSQEDISKLVALEIDPRAVAALEDLKKAAGDKFEIVEADALEVDLIALAPQSPRAIVANLPYNVATPLLIKWLKDIYQNRNAYRSMTLMFQKEVGQRIAAKLGDKHYGRLSVLSQWLCDVKILFDLPPQAFTPPPKVTSSVVCFRPKELSENVPDIEAVEKITAQAFGQRRKMVRQSLKPYRKFFGDVGLEETMRAEEISVEQFVELAHIVSTAK